MKMTPKHDSLAQLVEHLTFNQRVAGSSPARVTKFIEEKIVGMAHNFFLFLKNISQSLEKITVKANDSKAYVMEGQWRSNF